MKRAMKVLVVGDSHAEGWLPGSGLRSNAIARELGAPERLRLAVSGSTAVEWATDKDGRLTRALTEAARCEAAFISLLGNDLFRAAADGRVEAAEIAVAVAALYDVVMRVAAAVPRTFVLLYGYPFRDMDARKALALEDLDAAIAGVCGLAREVLGFGALIETVDERELLAREDWPGDDVHPHESGYLKIGREIRRRIDG